jgi:putative transcriptional regulator
MTAAPTRHPSEDLVLDLARGALERGRALVLRAHLAHCPACQQGLRLAEAVGGALVGELPPAEMAPDALAQALARIERPPPEPPPARVAPDGWIRVPPDVLEAAERHKRWAAPGVWVAPVTRNRKTGARSYLLGIGPGIAVPLHTHRGTELTCVVKGAYDDAGQIHAAGDFIETDESVEHRPRVTRDGECVCLIAADHALVPRDWVGWLFQPLVRI